MHTETLRRLLAAAKGEEPTDTVIKNGRIINVFTNSVEDGLAVSIKDGYVTGIEPEAGLVLVRKNGGHRRGRPISLSRFYRRPHAPR